MSPAVVTGTLKVNYFFGHNMGFFFSPPPFPKQSQIIFGNKDPLARNIFEKDKRTICEPQLLHDIEDIMHTIVRCQFL